MREVISIHIGQAGVQLGVNCWDLYCLEHGINFVTDDGACCLSPDPSTYDIRIECCPAGDWNNEITVPLPQQPDMDMECPIGATWPPCDCIRSEGFSSFFFENQIGLYSPRAIYVDTERTVIDQVRNGRQGTLYNPNNLISGSEDAANNYARGYNFGSGPVMRDFQVALNKQCESSEKLEGFMIFHSFGGGTGSGFFSALSEYMSSEYPRASNLEIGIYPSPRMSTAVVEPYNAIFATAATLETSQCVFLSDNEAMYNICNSRTNNNQPAFVHLNQLLAQTVSSVTASLRFKGSLNADFADFHTNLVPFPKIHFPIISYAPVSTGTTMTRNCSTILEITNDVFENYSRLISCDVNMGSYVSCCLLYRGDVAPIDVNAAILNIKQRKSINFVKWSPTGFKIGINTRAPSCVIGYDMAPTSRSVCMVANTTAVNDIWDRTISKYTDMLVKKAFIHWYTREGMDEQEFHTARNTMLDLQEEYEKM